MHFDDGRVSEILARTSDDSAEQAKEFVNLKPVAEQLIAIAQVLRDQDFPELENPISGKTDGERPLPVAAMSSPRSNTERARPLSSRRKAYAEMARDAYAIRRQRTGIFASEEIFGEPAWDILLDLYIAFCDDKPVSVSSACIGSASPSTTGLRWLGVLTEHNLIVREHDPEDQRRVLVRLSDKAVGSMELYFASAVKMERTLSE